MKEIDAAIEALEMLEPYVDGLVDYSATAAEWPMNRAPLKVQAAITGLRSLKEQEPVAYYYPGSDKEMPSVALSDDLDEGQKANCVPLYAAPVEQEPFCWAQPVTSEMYVDWHKSEYRTVPLYTHPAPEAKQEPGTAQVTISASYFAELRQRIAELEAALRVEPVAYLAWRDGKPCYEGDDAVCESAVWPVDGDDDRTSMPVYTADQMAAAVLRERERILALPQIKGNLFAERAIRRGQA